MTAYPTQGSSRTDPREVVWRELQRDLPRGLRPVPPYGLACPPRTPSPRPSTPCLRETWQLSGRSDHTPRKARALVADTCRLWHITRGIAPDLALIVSELATNAVAHAPGEALTVALLLTPSDVWVAVIDQGPRCPVEARQAGEDDEHGRGLALVEALASRYGAVPAGRGTAVWACLQLPPRHIPAQRGTSADDHAPTQDGTASPHHPEDSTDVPRSHS
ncbi:ATP-binding protein [Streptomyces sp. NPDC001492]